MGVGVRCRRLGAEPAESTAEDIAKGGGRGGRRGFDPRRGTRQGQRSYGWRGREMMWSPPALPADGGRARGGHSGRPRKGGRARRGGGGGGSVGGGTSPPPFAGVAAAILLGCCAKGWVGWTLAPPRSRRLSPGILREATH